MDFTMAMNYINEKNKLGSKPGLDNVKELLFRLDNPQNKCKCLHIAGTNGKGSIFSFVQEILIQAGYRVGRYISPTIFDYLERFQINKEYMSKKKFTEVLEKVSRCVDDMAREGLSSPTAFEIETAVAFCYFYEEEVDYVLVECGMGGLLDATNVMESPIVVAMASISRDHMDFLGKNIRDIAFQKTGIIKEGCKCVSYPQVNEAEQVIVDVCKEKNVELILWDEKEIEDVKYDLIETNFTYKGKEYKIQLLGEHQVKNAITAIEIASLIPDVKNEHIEVGLKKTKWQGRMTKVSDEPLMYVDGAHNEDAWLFLADTVNKYFTNRRIIYIIGVLKDKEYNRMIDILKGTMSYAITVTPNTPRGLDNKVLAKLIMEAGVGAVAADSAEEAINVAKSEAEKEDVIMVCGSLSFIGEYLNK